VEGGNRSSWEALDPGTPVLASGGESVGKVKEVLAAVEQDIFEGLLVETDQGERYVDEEAIDDIYDDRVVLKLDAGACHRLPEPSPAPAAMEVTPDDVSEGKAAYKRDIWFKRVWNRLSGKY
jgi:sporulation protein YlmC with PRC-barrel domain